MQIPLRPEFQRESAFHKQHRKSQQTTVAIRAVLLLLLMSFLLLLLLSPLYTADAIAPLAVVGVCVHKYPDICRWINGFSYQYYAPLNFATRFYGFLSPSESLACKPCGTSDGTHTGERNFINALGNRASPSGLTPGEQGANLRSHVAAQIFMILLGISIGISSGIQ